MKLLITGGAGFIGSNFIYYIQRRYPTYKMICLDALSKGGRLATLKSAIVHSNFQFIKGNIQDQDLVLSLFGRENFDIVVNFAAETHVDRSIHDSSEFIKTNILGTQILLDACRKFKTNWFHQISTDEVYGDLPIEERATYLNEDSPLRPSNPYAASKAAADLLVLSYFRTHGLPITISRCSNNYGPHQDPEKLIPLVITHAIGDKSIPIYGNGQNIRNWLYVEDHCSAIDLILHKGEPGQVYNVASSFEKPNIEVVNQIIHFLDKPESLITYVADRKGHDLRYGVDPTKIMTVLGWKSNTDINIGIESTIKWYIENKDWWS